MERVPVGASRSRPGSDGLAQGAGVTEVDHLGAVGRGAGLRPTRPAVGRNSLALVRVTARMADATLA